MRCFLFLSLALAFALTASTGQVRAPAAHIEGQIVDGVSGRPVAGVAVTALQGNSRQNISTDAQGRFAFTVTHGTVRITTGKAGYADVRPEGHALPTDGVLISLTPTQRLRGLTLPIFPSGSVLGHVYDVRNRPVQYAQVELQRYAYNDDGARSLQSVPLGRAPETDDHGEFHFSEVDAGEYYVRVIPPMLGERVPGEPFEATYYPSNIDSFRASPITVKGGEETALDDITLQSAPGSRIRIHLVNETGETVQHSTWLKYLHWQRVGAGPSLGATVLTPLLVMGGPDRAEIPVTPGRYEVVAGWSLNGGGVKGLGSVRVEVGRSDVPVDIVVRKGLTVTGHASSPGIRCSLGADGYTMSGLSATAATDGMMVFDNIQPATYRMNCTPLDAEAYLLDIKQGERDVIRDGLAVSNNDATNVFSITLGKPGGMVDGSVTDAKGTKSAGALAVLVPDEPQRDARQLYRTAIADQNGAFTIHGIAPGEYHAFAWTELNGAEYRNADFIQKFQGTPVKVAAGAKVSIRVEKE
jgi:Carboxypeptidase regulatory-like domain